MQLSDRKSLLKMASDALLDGVFAINKPCGYSSAQMIRECQKHFNPSALFKPSLEARRNKAVEEGGGHSIKRRQRTAGKLASVKMGHGGTLDPLATGVLILGMGNGTKLLPQFLTCTKTYETTLLFGASTDSYDRTGRVLTKRPYDHITKEAVLEALVSFRGKQKQMPPLYSALKMNGKPLYEYAREGKPIPREIQYRDVEALEVELIDWFEPETHSFRWPADEAEAVERNLAEQFWRLKKVHETGRRLTPEEKLEDDQAMAEHESFKRKFEERQDQLITDEPQKRRRTASPATDQTSMHGALGDFPRSRRPNKGIGLVGPPPDADEPPAWIDEGPAACKIRLTVTSGYYVRSFCHDLGAKLGSAAFMVDLCRIRQSDFALGGENTLEFSDLSKGEEVWAPKLAGMLDRWSTKGKETKPSAASKKPTSSLEGSGKTSSPVEPTKSSSLEGLEKPADSRNQVKTNDGEQAKEHEQEQPVSKRAGSSDPELKEEKKQSKTEAPSRPTPPQEASATTAGCE
ncbi:hypothetical protein CP533_5118 [Ophiocordyceps camponoti-saundersi (nom. inval.)]|nr:hypothetical protein CP533_5118 [Ophiocordyceps camponoti-saundersi (nom. inval.)]